MLKWLLVVSLFIGSIIRIPKLRFLRMLEYYSKGFNRDHKWGAFVGSDIEF